MRTGEFRVQRPSGANFVVPADPGEIPVHLTSFIGRESELGVVAGLLESARLLTVTGAGGSGKTRLAIEVASRVAPRFPHAAWVDLSPHEDPNLVPQLVGTALGIREETDRAPLESLVVALSQRSCIIILDNCEHLIDACRDLVTAVLKRCREVRFLATSREALGISGEQAWLMPPLSMPSASTDPRAVADTEAGQLFLERARSVLPNFRIDERNAAAVAHICRRLDGMPLAIELAAARVRVLAPEQIAARLEEDFGLLAAADRCAVPRHRTLAKAIDWSHALLSEPEAALFRRLAVFAGNFSFDAVESICPKPPVAQADVLELLCGLVDKSMVVMDPNDEMARYRLLETLRQFALDRLKSAGEEREFRARHAHFFVELACAAERPTFGGGFDRDWTNRLFADEGNLRLAADWLAHAPEGADGALRLAAALHWHWFARGQFRIGTQQLDAALGRSDGMPSLSRAKALCASAAMAFWSGKHEAITARAEEAVGLLRELNDPWFLSYAITTKAIGQSFTDPHGAQAALAEAVATARTLGTSILLGFTLYWEGRIAIATGDLDQAVRSLEECVAVGLAIGHGPATAHPRTLLGGLEVQRGELRLGASHLFDSLRIHAANNDMLGCVWTLEGLARLAHRSNEPRRASRLLGAALAERERLGTSWSDREKKEFTALIEHLRQTAGGSAFDVEWSMGQSQSLPEAVEFAMAGADAVLDSASPPAPIPEIHVTPEGGISVLEVRALGELRVLVNGKPLDKGALSSARTRELLLFLLCHPAGRTREQIGVAFWPEASSKQVRNNFHVTMHRLRKALGGAPWITFEGDKYAIDQTANVAFDALQFEREMKAALPALKGTGDTGPLEAALARYEGDFLEYEDVGDWHFELRDRLRHLYVFGLQTLGTWWSDREQWQEAAEMFKRLIARDELNESAYRDLMRCYVNADERSQAIRLYQRLEHVLTRELDAEPEAETRALLNRIRVAGAGPGVQFSVAVSTSVIPLLF